MPYTLNCNRVAAKYVFPEAGTRGEILVTQNSPRAGGSPSDPRP